MLSLLSRSLPRVASRISCRRSVSSMSSLELFDALSTPSSTPAHVIDVRPSHEIRDVTAFNGGKSLSDYLPLSVRGSAEDFVHEIPLDSIMSGEWLDMSPDDFEDEYDFPHPLHPGAAEDQVYIFSCKAGVRSAVAAEIFEGSGVKNCVNFVDGAAGWDSYMRSR